MFEAYNLHLRSIILVFALILIFSVGIFVQNAFADQVVATIPVGSKPWGVAVNPNTDRIYVANSDCCLTSPTISVIDGTTNNVINTIPVLGRPSGVAVNPTTNMIYVAEGGMRVQVINGSTNSIVGTIFLYGPESGNIPHEITVNPVTNMIYVTYYTTEHFGTIGGGPSRVAVINGTSNTVVNTLNEINYPNGIAANQVTNKIYVAIGTYGINANNAVSVIDGSDNSSMNNINVSNSPNFVAVNQNTNKIYVTEYSGNKLAVIDGTTDSVMTDISVGSIPYGVGVNVDTNKIFVANNENNTVSVIDGLSNQVLDTIPVGQSPYEIAVNPNTNKIYVTNQGSNTVSVIDGNSPILGIYPGWQSCCYGMLSVNGMVQNPIAGINQLQVSIFAPNGTLVLNKTESTRGFQVDYLMHRSDGAGNYTIIGTYAKMSVQKTIPSFITGNATISIRNSFESLSDGTIYTSGLATNAISAEKISISFMNSSNTIVASNIISINNHAQYLDILGPLSTAGNYTVTATFLYNGATAKYHLAYVCATSNCVTPAIPSSTTTTITISSNKTIPDNPFTLTATVLPSSATGTIQFQVDGTNLETPVTLSGGTARMTTSLPTGTHDITASYSGDSNFAPSISGQYTITVQTPALATQNMIIIVNNMTLTQGTTKSLDAKLDATISYLNANDTYDARNTLQSFISEVNAQTGKHITQDQANQLVVTARNIIKAIP